MPKDDLRVRSAVKADAHEALVNVGLVLQKRDLELFTLKTAAERLQFPARIVIRLISTLAGARHPLRMAEKEMRLKAEPRRIECLYFSQDHFAARPGILYIARFQRQPGQQQVANSLPTVKTRRLEELLRQRAQMPRIPELAKLEQYHRLIEVDQRLPCMIVLARENGLRLSKQLQCASAVPSAVSRDGKVRSRPGRLECHPQLFEPGFRLLCHKGSFTGKVQLQVDLGLIQPA